MSIDIIPAIIAKNIEDLEDKMSSLSQLVPIVQIDVLDGSLAHVRSWPYQSPSKSDLYFESIVNEEAGFPFWKDLDFEAHLMVRKPEDIIPDWISAGATRIIFQIEGVSDFEGVFEAMPQGVDLGVSIALDTPDEKIEAIADKVSIIQCMGWNIQSLGLQGQPFNEKTIDRIKHLRHKYPDHVISIDGGVNLDNAQALVSAGANRLVVGSALWQGNSVVENLEEFSKIQ